MNINGIEIRIHKSWYNKSIVQEDGVTHTINTEHQYPVYQLGLSKNYFDIDDKNEVVDSIISDLKQVVEKLEQLREGEKESQSVERG